MNQPTSTLSASRSSAADRPRRRRSELPPPAALERPPARVAVVSARWHGDLVQRAREAACATFASAADERTVHVEPHEVPGALEIPLAAQRLARSGRIDAVVAIAFVVDGGIYRHDFVAQAVIDGLMRVQLDTDVPVLSCVLTPQAFHEHAVHERFFAEHLAEKGREVARACLGMLSALEGVAAAAPPTPD